MTRVLVVGGGVVGTMHALLAVRAGHHVVQVERDAAPTGASVRNFGLVWVSGRADGDELAAAQRARELWEELAGIVPGIGFRADPSLTVALSDVEAKVMRAYAEQPGAALRGTTWLEADQVRERNRAIRGPAVGGALFGALDAVVEPAQVLPAIQSHLESSGRYERYVGHHVLDVEVARRRWRADVVVLCPGAWPDGVAAEALAGAPLRRVRLQMMQTAPLAERLATSIADADSLRYYPAYATAALDDLPPQPAVAAEHAVQLLLVQRASGALTIGDTHRFDEPFDFALDEAPYDHLRAAAEAILGTPLPATVRRWAGVYSQCTTPGQLCHRAEVAPATWIVTGLGGRGMTCSPAVAEQTLSSAGLT